MAWPGSVPSHAAGVDAGDPRAGDGSDPAQQELTADGPAVPAAIRHAARGDVRLLRREQLHRESVEVSADPADVAESRHVLAEMADLRAW